MPHTVTRATDNPAQARAVDGRPAYRETVALPPPHPPGGRRARGTHRRGTDARDAHGELDRALTLTPTRGHLLGTVLFAVAIGPVVPVPSDRPAR